MQNLAILYWNEGVTMNEEIFNTKLLQSYIEAYSTYAKELAVLKKSRHNKFIKNKNISKKELAKSILILKKQYKSQIYE